MIGTGERPVLASCFICTFYPARPQPHLSIPVVWDLKSKMKKIIIRNNAHAHTHKCTYTLARICIHTHRHTHAYCYTWFFLNLDYAQRDRRRRRALPIHRLYTFFTDCYGEKKRKETITNIVKRTRYTIKCIILLWVYMCNVVARSRIWGVDQGVYVVLVYTCCIVIDVSSLTVDCIRLTFFSMRYKFFVAWDWDPSLSTCHFCRRRPRAYSARRSSSKNLYFKCIHRAVDLKTVLSIRL